MRLVIICSFVFLSVGFAIGQGRASLNVAVQAKNNQQKGKVVVLLFKQSKGFPKEVGKAYKTKTIENFPKVSSVNFDDLPFGKYAVAIFWDKNRNGIIDSNFIGMPKESIGASNMKKLGRPSFSKSAFQVNQSEQKITVKFLN